MSITKRDVARYAAEHDIEIEDNGRDEDRHIHAYSPDGFVFAATDTHNIGCYDGGWCEGKPVDWNHVFEQIQIVPCPYGDECEVCHPEKD